MTPSPSQTSGFETRQVGTEAKRHVDNPFEVRRRRTRRARPASAVIILCLWSLAGTVSPAWAQDDVTPSPDQPAPTQKPANGDGGGLTLDFRGAMLETILEYLSERAGMIVMNNINLDERINVYSRRPVSTVEAIALLDSVLYEKGYTAVRRGRLLKIVKLNDAKTQNIPVFFGSDPELIGDSDTIITQVIPVKYAKAAGLAQNIGPLINSDFAELAANESSNALILTDVSANVKRIAKIVRALDQSISQVTVVRVFQLQYADATDTARLIEEIFESGPSEAERLGRTIQQRFGRFRGGARGGADQAATADSGTGLQSLQVSAATDVRTNSVVVSAAPDLMDPIATVIEELDADTTAKQSVMIYHVRNMQATELSELLNSLFTEPTPTGGAAQRTNRGGGGRFGPRPNDADAGPDQEATADLVGQVTAVASAETNSLLVLTQEKNFDRIRTILDDLDRPVPQVLIRVLVSEVTLDDDLDLGVEFEGINVGATDDTNVKTNFNLFESSLGLNFLLLDSTNFKLALRALEATGRFDLLSRPYLLTADNQEANITVGESVPFITNSRETNEGQTINTIDYRDVGIILTVTPQINDDGLVVLSVTQELSALTEDTIPISEELDAVIIKQRTLSTKVAVTNGHTVIIGGLMGNALQERISKVPFFGSLPIVGNLFTRTERMKAKTELLLFLTPEVIEKSSDLRQTTQRVQQQDTSALKDAIEPGLLQEHLDKMAVPPPETTTTNEVPPEPSPNE